MKFWDEANEFREGDIFIYLILTFKYIIFSNKIVKLENSK